MAEKHGLRRFEIYSLPWRDVAPFVVTAYGPDDAVEAWCQAVWRLHLEPHWNCADDLPDPHDLRVLDGADEKVMTVTTKFQPTFHITEKPDDR